MNDLIPKISIEDLSTLLGAAVGAPVDARELQGAVLRRPPPGTPPQLSAEDLFERYFKAARRQ